MSGYSFIKSTTTSTGTGTLTLATTVDAPYRTLQSLYENYHRFAYYLKGADNSWERGWGYITSDVFTRDIIIESSNYNSAINLPSGTHEVYQAPSPVITQLDASFYSARTEVSAIVSRRDNPDQTISNGGGLVKAKYDYEEYDVFYQQTSVSRLHFTDGDGSIGLSIPDGITRFKIDVSYYIYCADDPVVGDLILALQVPFVSSISGSSGDLGGYGDRYVWQRPYKLNNSWTGYITTGVISKSPQDTIEWNGLYILNQTGYDVIFSSGDSYSPALNYAALTIYE